MAPSEKKPSDKIRAGSSSKTEREARQDVSKSATKGSDGTNSGPSHVSVSIETARPTPAPAIRNVVPGAPIEPSGAGAATAHQLGGLGGLLGRPNHPEYVGNHGLAGLMAAPPNSKNVQQQLASQQKQLVESMKRMEQNNQLLVSMLAQRQGITKSNTFITLSVKTDYFEYFEHF